jgi:hypothetical protein
MDHALHELVDAHPRPSGNMRMHAMSSFGGNPASG